MREANNNPTGTASPQDLFANRNMIERKRPLKCLGCPGGQIDWDCGHPHTPCIEALLS
jgi:hypothetical protein